jgi:glycosyltransferase involved in cell wall biosynthesis
MHTLSVVIVCKNEAGIIGHTLKSLKGLTDDIIVYDNGSTDDTIDIVRQQGARLIEGGWEGFGKTKHKATMLAKYDWVLSLDADEPIDEELKQSLGEMNFNDASTVYSLRFKNFFGNKWLRFGEWGGDKHVRLFNRKSVNWDDAPVHERLVILPNTKVKTLPGHVLHQTARDVEEYSQKISGYATLNAEKYFRQGKKASWFRIRFSPLFSFIQNYFLKLGFLDGSAGYTCARMTAHYTFLKYSRLRELNQEKK